jgi:integrase
MARGYGVGSVYQRKSDGMFVASVQLPPDPLTGKRHRKVVYAKTRPAARAKARQLLAKRDTGQLAAGRTPTVETWLAHYLDVVCPQRGLKPSTIDGYRSKVHANLLPYLARRRIDQVSVTDVRRLVEAEHQRGQSPSSVRGALTVLQGALRVAQAEGRIASNPVTLVDKPHQRRRRDPEGALTIEETRRVLEAAHGDRLEARWWAAFIGLRRSEALGMRWGHEVDLGARLLHVEQTAIRARGRGIVMGETKSATSDRWLPLTPTLIAPFRRRWVAYLEEREHAADHWQEHGLVVCQPNGRPIGASADWKAWRDLLARAGVRYVRPHDARHTAATLLLEAGVDVRIVQAWLGHSSIDLTVGTYTRVRAKLLAQAGDALGELLGGEGDVLQGDRADEHRPIPTVVDHG